MDEWGIKFLIKGQWVDLKDLIEKAEKYDAINWNAIRATLDEKIETEQKLEAIKSWRSVFNQNIESADARERLAEVLGADG